MARVTAFGPDLLMRIVNVQWGIADQQGLLAEYPPNETIPAVMGGTPTAYALDSGESFPGINMGASGLGFTVMTAGLVCFGKPRDGDACFIACSGFVYFGASSGDALQRGIVGEEGDLVWSSTGGDGAGKLVALTFAGDAFFAVYFNNEDNTTSIATSLDGTSWVTSSAFPSSGEGAGLANGGAVAATIKPNPDPEGPPLRTYVAAGSIEQDFSEIANSISNLMWAISDTGTEWKSDSNEGVLAEPGTWYDLTGNYACTIAAGPISKTNQIFVAAAGTKTSIANPFNPDVPFIMLTAAAAQSETGTTWETIQLPEALPAALNQESFGLAVTFVRVKEGTGYFLLSDHEVIEGIEGEPDHAVPSSTLYKSADGQNWSSIRKNNNWMATLSAIVKDLSKTTIVTI